ncbi:NnrU family protein [Granulosicoccus sp. 3-233]|uniref:NnrU family protein n=1 Tax=Granulosicoccus sp. 3-233 TaxID=3417969 RepID=UPI003D327E8B
MIQLITGLILFLGMHSIRFVAEGKREQFINARGELLYKGLYSLVSLLGLVLIVMGYSATRLNPVFIWTPPLALSHVSALLMLLSFILLAAAYIPGTRMKAALGHPMVLGVKVWAVAHLLANGRLGDIVLFGAFLVWAIVDYAASRRRDRRDGIVRQPAAGISRDAMAVVIGGLAWFAFAFWLHLVLIGVSPFAV